MSKTARLPDRQAIVQRLEAAAARAKITASAPATSDQCQILADLIIKHGNVSLYEHYKWNIYALSQSDAAEMIEEALGA